MKIRVNSSVMLLAMAFMGCDRSVPPAAPLPTPIVTSVDRQIAATSADPPESVPAIPANATASEASETEATSATSSVADLPAERLLVLTSGGPIIVDVVIAIDGRKLGDAMDAFASEILKMADADGDGRTTWDELTRHPRIAKGQLGNEAIANEKKRTEMIDQYDLNRDKVVSANELPRFFIRDAMSSRAFVVRNTNTNRDLNQRGSLVRKLLDDNEDGVIDIDEQQMASQRLRSRDSDDDELLFMTDLRPLIDLMPDAGPKRKVWGPDSVMYLGPKVDWDEVLYSLQETYALGGPLNKDSFRVPPSLFAALDEDKNNVVRRKEIERLMTAEPQVRFEVRFGAGTGATDGQPRLTNVRVADEIADYLRVEYQDETSCVFVTDDMVMNWTCVDEAGVDDSEQRAAEIVKLLDKNSDGYLEASEIPEEGSPLMVEFSTVDEDGDEKIFPAEIAKFFQGQRGALRGQVRVLVDHREDALFAALDTDHDGRLDWREVSNVSQRLQSLDRDKDSRLTVDEIPGAMTVRISRGGGNVPARSAEMVRPRAPMADLPIWFQKMDTNHDGAISVREFLGDADTFANLDANGDGFLEWTEANGRLNPVGQDQKP